MRSEKVSRWRVPLVCGAHSQTACLELEALFQCAIVDKGGVRWVWIDDSQCVGAGKIDYSSLDP